MSLDENNANGFNNANPTARPDRPRSLNDDAQLPPQNNQPPKDTSKAKKIGLGVIGGLVLIGGAGLTFNKFSHHPTTQTTTKGREDASKDSSLGFEDKENKKGSSSKSHKGGKAENNLLNLLDSGKKSSSSSKGLASKLDNLINGESGGKSGSAKMASLAADVEKSNDLIAKLDKASGSDSSKAPALKLDMFGNHLENLNEHPNDNGSRVKTVSAATLPKSKADIINSSTDVKPIESDKNKGTHKTLEVTDYPSAVIDDNVSHTGSKGKDSKPSKSDSGKKTDSSSESKIPTKQGKYSKMVTLIDTNGKKVGKVKLTYVVHADGSATPSINLPLLYNLTDSNEMNSYPDTLNVSRITVPVELHKDVQLVNQYGNTVGTITLHRYLDPSGSYSSPWESGDVPAGVKINWNDIKKYPDKIKVFSSPTVVTSQGQADINENGDLPNEGTATIDSATNSAQQSNSQNQDAPLKATLMSTAVNKVNKPNENIHSTKAKHQSQNKVNPYLSSQTRLINNGHDLARTENHLE
ncbi:hypothetical protein [Lactobacillus crispatus]|uniref:hypothetical protein n=1 Tax=Lactobacillus crispatus TaxID=47770 RepID=UPI0022CDDEFF|nr:hypothetical protein [Lactobacillus crispatus]MCZ9662494.1 hypothetical protein [Lactobacillus crispatus]